jgi:hypothetical protein
MHLLIFKLNDMRPLTEEEKAAKKIIKGNRKLKPGQVSKPMTSYSFHFDDDKKESKPEIKESKDVKPVETKPVDTTAFTIPKDLDFGTIKQPDFGTSGDFTFSFNNVEGAPITFESLSS